MKKPINLRKSFSFHTILFVLVTCVSFLCGGCFHYGFTGASIPEGVNSIYIPFFPNNSSSSVPNISSKLNEVLVNRFVQRSSLTLASNRSTADAILVGSINSYTDEPFSISGKSRSTQNKVTITVSAKFKFSNKNKVEWNKLFRGSATYNPTKNPIQGENKAALEALEQIANNMFNSAVSDW